MRRISIESTTILAAALAAASASSTAGCGDDPRGTTAGNDASFLGSPDGGDAGADDAAAGDDGPAPKLDAAGGGGLTAPLPAGLAVVASDYVTTSISLVSPSGTLVQDSCVNSATGASGQLSLTLSGDVTLPSQPQRGNEVWLIDRGNAALTVVDPASCRIVRQFSVSTGFKSNPHDVVVVSDAKAYVTRFEKNLVPTSANSDGDDVLIVDPRSGAISGRIDLSSYAAPVSGAAIQARPDRAVIAGGRVLVTLASQNADFSSAGEGRVVSIDPSTDRVAGVAPITGMKGCSEMGVLPGSSTVFVACGGSFADADQALESGVAIIDAAASPFAVTGTFAAQVFGTQPVDFAWVVAVTPVRAFASMIGAMPPGAAAIPDTLFAFDPTTGHSQEIAVLSTYSIGRGVAGGGRLFVPDATASAPLLHVYDGADSATPTESAAFNPAPASGLPPREVAWY
jgi:hypothetical protein